MRLLHTKTLEFKDFMSPPYTYVILSHTWGDGEVSFQDMQIARSEAEKKAGFEKIRGTCQKAEADGYDYAWIDTCCIDKTSSAELSEAINSMYSWYQNAEICYVYLADVQTRGDVINHLQSDYEYPLSGDLLDTIKQFRRSRWFTRGWTLQELIAPRIVQFYAADWTELGTKRSLMEHLVDITGIPEKILGGRHPATCNVAERFSWAAKRATTRVEDSAYSLLGIFNINMPLIYGEGRKALIRLQEEILKITEDYTILAWGNLFPSPLQATRNHITSKPSSIVTACLTNFLRNFELRSNSPYRYSDLTPATYMGLESSPATMTARGLRISLLLGPWITQETGGIRQAYINLTWQNKPVSILLFRPKNAWPDVYWRCLDSKILLLEDIKSFKMETFYLGQKTAPFRRSSRL